MNKRRSTVTVLGLGYIGLPTALLMADNDIKVFGFDISKDRVNLLKDGTLPFSENGLKELFEHVKQKNTFQATTQLVSSDFYLIAVPTPQDHGKADLIYVIKALEMIEPIFQANQTIIIESTIGPRDCEDVLIPLIQKWKKKFHFVHCPERAIPGNTLLEMVHNDRIIGGYSLACAEKVGKLYSHFVKGPLHLTTPVVAASCKVMENTYRAVNIALSNEFTQLAEELHFNVWEAISLANRHPRVNIHEPGPGVGGHCIPIDPWFFVGNSTGKSLIKLALEKNASMAEYVFQSIEESIRIYQLKNPIVGILGFAYKKNVDDARETPAEPLKRLLEKKYKVLITDPFIKQPFISSEKEVLENANLIVIVTNHDHYQKIDFAKHTQLKIIYDSRNSLTLSQKKSFKGQYVALGNTA